MARWGERIALTSYRYVRVSRETGEEVGVLDVLKGGTITRNDDVRIKERAEATLLGEADFGPDLVRVRMVAEWEDGEVEDVVLGTFIPVVPGRSVRAGYSTGTLKMYGRLQELYDSQFALPVTVERGENAVARARRVCEDMGLEVVSEGSDYAVTDTRYYGVSARQNNSEVGDTKLDMVNDLLDLAGFRAAYTDPMGRVVFERYRDPSEIAPSWDFSEGPGARFESSMREERDYTSTANHVTVIYGPDDEGECVVGEAWDRDPGSDLSTVSRGRVIDRTYTYNDLPPGKTPAERRAYADRRAASLLSTAQSIIHRVNMTHVYAPVAVNDTVTVSFPSGGVEGKFQVRTQSMSLVGGCPVSTEIRQFRRRSRVR